MIPEQPAGFQHGDELRRQVVAILPLLNFQRGQTLTKADELQIESVQDRLAKAAHLCEICESPDTKDYADATGCFIDSFCELHSDLAWKRVTW